MLACFSPVLAKWCNHRAWVKPKSSSGRKGNGSGENGTYIKQAPSVYSKTPKFLLMSA